MIAVGTEKVWKRCVRSACDGGRRRVQPKIPRYTSSEHRQSFRCRQPLLWLTYERKKVEFSARLHYLWNSINNDPSAGFGIKITQGADEPASALASRGHERRARRSWQAELDARRTSGASPWCQRPLRRRRFRTARAR